MDHIDGEAERRAEGERQRADNAEKETRPTTLDEYINACHDLVFTKFSVQTNKSLTSKGSITNPRNKFCPTRLEPWVDFLEEQRITFGAVYSTLTNANANDDRSFESQAFLRGLGARVSRRAISNEKDLEHFQHNSVEDPVRSIVQRLTEEAAFHDEFNVGDGIIFENHPSAISDVAEEVVERQGPPVTPPRTPGPDGFDRGQLRPDQICVYTADEQSSLRNMAYVMEYKAPHKLTPVHMRAGLHSMDIHKQVVNRATVPTADDQEALFQYHAERLATAAITQTYHYMMESGLEYGLLTTGETIVFLKIDWQKDPGTLYFHLAEPGPEVLAHPDNLRSCTAVSQTLTFSLMAVGPPGRRRQHGQDERQQAMERLKTWSEDYEIMLRSIPVSERTAPADSPAYEPRTSPESSDDEPERPLPSTPTPAPRAEGQGTRRSQRILARRPRGGGNNNNNSNNNSNSGTGGAGAGEGSSGRPGGSVRQYCSQKCLRGLMAQSPLDKGCPNVMLHREHDDGRQTHHPVDHSEWLRLLRKQLKRSLDEGVVPLGKEGSRGVLFQLTLLKYGYTFVSKGTVAAFIEDLEHEAAVYQHLHRLQGISVPVFMGAIDLRDLGRTYYYDLRVYIVHLSFLSWGGESLDCAENLCKMDKSLEREVLRSLRELHMEGVVHLDVREANALINHETGRVMIIDFERASILEKTRRPPAPGGVEDCTAVSQPRPRQANDILMARSMFASVAR
ncbi:uncharacterized protein NECHADRAFT_94028 [Fusarium vanettenii 77-13-4]|uniref:Protein kinase domain-containing protein n=1 Tax=Fusarium vanettenii (strain ATCC MYA-4622 / CBS 123669 / FGSC 9596 / NRRL 45880 / 77-13-4) TaxID=660122 RepID=C7ZGD8_FUSV7|nr:uncharacterized protein NECHADRAFT_94028 [Fusarium vanettenii 77-13-4]EEU36831.1 hypothetical protein NECHADRAFT_94028 [Fusarium vanettenii 77-13-4]